MKIEHKKGRVKEDGHDEQGSVNEVGFHGQKWTGHPNMQILCLFCLFLIDLFSREILMESCYDHSNLIWMYCFCDFDTLSILILSANNMFLKWLLLASSQLPSNAFMWNWKIFKTFAYCPARLRPFYHHIDKTNLNLIPTYFVIALYLNIVFNVQGRSVLYFYST